MHSIASFWDNLFGGLPQVVVAIIILIIAFLVSWLVKLAVTGLFKLIRLDKLIAKSGVQAEHVESIRAFVGKLAYFATFLLFLPGVLDRLGLTSVSTPIVAMMNGVLVYLPHIIAAVILLIIGIFIGKTVKEILVPVLKGLKLDSWLKKAGLEFKGKTTVADILGIIAQVVIVTVFVVEGLNALQLDILTRVGGDIIAYLPYAASAVIIIMLAILVGNYVETLISTNFKNSKGIAMIAKVVVVTLGVFITLYQLGIAPSIINSAFVLILGALAVAFAIAFGVGGRDFAKHRLDKLEQKLDAPTKK